MQALVHRCQYTYRQTDVAYRQTYNKSYVYPCIVCLDDAKTVKSTGIHVSEIAICVYTHAQAYVWLYRTYKG